MALGAVVLVGGALGRSREKETEGEEHRESERGRGGCVASPEKARASRGSGKQEVAGARVRARRPHALLPTGRRWKTTGRSPWWAGLALPSWAATVPGQVGFAR